MGDIATYLLRTWPWPVAHMAVACVAIKTNYYLGDVACFASGMTVAVMLILTWHMSRSANQSKAPDPNRDRAPASTDVDQT